VKANRYITHMKRLNDPLIPLANFFASGILGLKEKLGPILWQFPPNMTFDPDKFEAFLKLLPHDFKAAARLGKSNELDPARVMLEVNHNRRIRHAVEVRNHSFLNPWFIELLRKYDVAVVFADTAGKWPYFEDVTSDFIYIRLHGDSKIYVSGYDDETLNFWAHRIKAWCKGKQPGDKLTLTDEKVPVIRRDVFVYFDNDAKVRAPVDAKALLQKIIGTKVAH